MISGTTLVIKFLWYEIIKDIILMFEQWFYISILSSTIPGSMYLANYIIQIYDK